MERAQRTEATALVIDDDVVLRSTLAELLLGEGFAKVIQASNGFSGLRIAVEQHPQVVLLDLLLPELSGMDVLRELRSSPVGRDLAIVVVTGWPEHLTEGQLAETDGIVRKPFDVTALLMTLQRAIQRAAARATEIAPVATAIPTLAAHRGSKRSKLSTSSRRTRGRR